MKRERSKRKLRKPPFRLPSPRMRCGGVAGTRDAGAGISSGPSPAVVSTAFIIGTHLSTVSSCPGKNSSCIVCPSAPVLASVSLKGRGGSKVTAHPSGPRPSSQFVRVRFGGFCRRRLKAVRYPLIGVSGLSERTSAPQRHVPTSGTLVRVAPLLVALVDWGARVLSEDV